MNTISNGKKRGAGWDEVGIADKNEPAKQPSSAFLHFPFSERRSVGVQESVSREATNPFLSWKNFSNKTIDSYGKEGQGTGYAER